MTSLRSLKIPYIDLEINEKAQSYEMLRKGTKGYEMGTKLRNHLGMELRDSNAT